MAATLLEEMYSRDLQPDNVSYNSVISACGKGGQWQLALDLIGRMRKAGLVVSVGVPQHCVRHAQMLQSELYQAERTSTLTTTI